MTLRDVTRVRDNNALLPIGGSLSESLESTQVSVIIVLC
jgi:hypothetical protein